MPHFLRFAALLGGLALGCANLAQARDVDAASYGYPLTNPFEATIATTPPELRPELPHSEDIDQKDYSLKLRPEREFALPDNFWPVKKLRYRLARPGSCGAADLHHCRDWRPLRQQLPGIPEEALLPGRLPRGAVVLADQLGLHGQRLALRHTGLFQRRRR